VREAAERELYQKKLEERKWQCYQDGGNAGLERSIFYRKMKTLGTSERIAAYSNRKFTSIWALTTTGLPSFNLV